jgi:hypothetical protein
MSLLIITTFTSLSFDAFLRLLRMSLRKTKLKAFEGFLASVISAILFVTL